MKKFFIFVCTFTVCVSSFANIERAEFNADPSRSEMAVLSSEMGPDDDGFIYKGTITLTRVGSGRKDTFLLFNKRGVNYVAVRNGGPYIRLERRMTINNIDYIY
jgi:hypothetical protein